MRAIHAENHRTHRIGWLRAAVLGANDGVVSTAALIVGVAGAGSDRGTVLIAGLAGLVAGAMSMAAGEYVSVSSQADAEAADRAREQEELATMPEAELAELRDIYVERGLDAELATRVAEQLMAGDALKAHLRDELGITESLAARPLQAAAVSAATFRSGPPCRWASRRWRRRMWRCGSRWRRWPSCWCWAALAAMQAARPSGRAPCASLSGARWR